MKKNCICLSCKNLDEDFIPKGKVKCLFQIDTDETIEGDLLKGETDKCPFDFYEKKDDDTWWFKNESAIPFMLVLFQSRFHLTNVALVPIMKVVHVPRFQKVFHAES